MLKTKLAVHYLPINDLRPADYNPRLWDKQAADQLKASLKRFGFVDPIIANSAPNRKNIIIGGHFRWTVAKEMGIKTIPVVYVHIPNLAKEKELNLRLNRNVGSWNFDLLKKFDVDLLLDIGFDDHDLSHIWDDALATEDDNFDVDRELKKIGHPKTKPGDKYQLGQHLLVCGDATDPATVTRLAKTQSVSMIYFDPPYNIALDYHKGISTAGNYGGSINDKKSPAAYKEFLTKTLANGLNICRPDCHVFYWCDESNIGLIQEIYRDFGLNSKRVCLWIKNNFNMTPQQAFNKAYEPCVYATRGKPYLAPSNTNLTEILNKEVSPGNRTIDDILDIFNIWLVKRLPATDYLHPTEKPPILHEKALRRCTKPGEMVLDLFAGSGSTMVACEQMKRRTLMIELEPIFCDLVVRRYESFTNQKAKLIH